MQIVPLYRFKRPSGGITVSPIKPECEYTELVRLIADEGKLLTDGETVTPCIDTDTAEGWWEIDEPEEPDSDEPMEAAIYDGLEQVYREGVNSIDK